MDLGNIRIGAGFDSSQLTSGISKALGDLTRLTDGLKKAGLQGIEPLQRKLETFQQILSKAPNTSAWGEISTEFNKITASAETYIQKLVKLKDTSQGAYTAMARGKPLMEELNGLSKALIDLTTKLTSVEGQKTDAVNQGNKALEARRFLLDKIAKTDAEAASRILSQKIIASTPQGEVARLSSLGFVGGPDLSSYFGKVQEGILGIGKAWKDAKLRQDEYNRSLAPLDFTSAMAGATSGGLVRKGTSLGGAIQQEIMLGDVFGKSPNKNIISLMTQEVEKLTRSLSELGTREGITPLTEKFTALGQRVLAVKNEINSLTNASINADKKLSLEEQTAAGKRLVGGLAVGGAFSTEILSIQAGLKGTAGELQLNTYKNLRQETDNLIQANSKLGTSQLELGMKAEGLRTAMGNVKEMAHSGKGNIVALNAEYDKHKATLHDTEKALGKFESAGHRHGMTIQSLIKWQIEWYFTQNLIFGATGIFASGIKNMVEFEQKMANLQAITNSTTADTELMGKAARQLGMNSRMSALEIADGMTIIGQAGFSAKETIQAMGAAVALSTSTLSNMAISTDLITTALRAFEKDASQAAEVANVFAASTNYSKLTMDDLKTAFNYVAVIGKQAGLSLEEVNSTLGATRNVGIQASTAATGFRGMLGSLIAPSERFRKELEKHNIALRDVNPLYNDWITVLRRLKDLDIESAFRGLDKRIAGFTMAAIKSVDMNEELLKSITNTNAAFEMQAIQLGTTQSNLKMISNNISEVGLKISEVLLPPVYALSLGFSELLKYLNNLSPGFDNITKQILLGATAVGILTSSVVLLVKYFIPFVAGLLGITAATGGFFATIGAFLTGGWGIALIAILSGIATYFGITAYESNKAKQAMLDFNKEAGLNIIILSSAKKEIDNYKDGSVELAAVVDRLVSLYPELASKANIYKGSVTLLKVEIDKLTESQNNLFLASVAATLGVAEEARKGINIPREKRLLPGSEMSMGMGGLPYYTTKEPTYDEIKKKIEGLKKIQQDLFKEQGAVGKDTAKFAAVRENLAKNQALLDEYDKYLKSYESTITKIRKYEEINKGRDVLSASWIAGLGLTELPPEILAAKVEKGKAPPHVETDKERRDRLARERDEITFKEKLADQVGTLDREINQRKLEALRTQGKEEAVEIAESEIRKDILNKEYKEKTRNVQVWADLELIKEKGQYFGKAAELEEIKGRQITEIETRMFQLYLSEEERKNSALLKIREKVNKTIWDEEEKYQKELLRIKKDNTRDIVAYDTTTRKEQFQDEQELINYKIKALKEEGSFQIDSLRVRGKLIKAELLQHNLNLQIIENKRLDDIKKIKEEKEKLLEGGVEEEGWDPEKLKKYFDTSREDRRNAIAAEEKSAEYRRSAAEIKKARGKTPMEGLLTGLSNMSIKFGTFGDQVQTFTETGLQSFTDGMANAFTDFVNGTKSAEEAFRDFAKSFIQEVLKMINQMLAMYVVQQIVGLAGKLIMAGAGTYAGGAGSGTYSTGAVNPGGYSFIPAGATGGVFPNIKSFQSFSSGGMTSRPALALLGDNASSKELVIPSENIKEDSVSGYMRDKSQRLSLVNINLIDPMMVPAIMAAYPGATLNIISADIAKKGITYQQIKQAAR